MFQPGTASDEWCLQTEEIGHSPFLGKVPAVVCFFLLYTTYTTALVSNNKAIQHMQGVTGPVNFCEVNNRGIDQRF